MNPFDSSELLKARDLLLAGEVVVMPTETVYGLASSIESEAGLRKVFALKERPFFDPLIVHVASLKEAARMTTEWPPLVDFIARRFWPGPLTLVLPKASHVNPLITSGLDTVAIRYPSHPLAQDLIRMTGTPLAAPSANKFGRTSPSKAEHVRSEFAGQDLLILDGGDCEIGVESTVLDFSDLESEKAVIRILRPGGITREMLENALSRWSKPVQVLQATSEASPGNLKHHYMPSIPLVIIGEDEPQGLSDHTRKKIATEIKIGSIQDPAELVLNEDAVVAARELYSELRRLSQNGHDLIYVRAVHHKKEGLWLAIWDRLTRAASLNLASS